MANNKIESVIKSDMNDLLASQTPANTSSFQTNVPAADSTSEESYMMDWNKWNGYMENVPALASIILRKAMWTVGKGFTADRKTTKILNSWRGNGKGSATTIFFNGVVVYTAGGDFFAEIVRTKRGKITNLKPLNPGTVKVNADKFGIIKNYEVQPLNGEGNAIPIALNDMFHLPWNAIADQIHGNSTIKKLERTIDSYNESKEDMRVVFHRYVKPLWIFSVDEDDDDKLKSFKNKVDQTIQKAENMVVPKDTVDKIERISIPQFSTLDPIPWIKLLEMEFVKAEGVPNPILGAADEVTEASAKVLYLAFQQMVEWNQKFLEDNIKNQLGLDLKFVKPISLEPEIQKDAKKDGKINSDINETGNTGVNSK